MIHNLYIDTETCGFHGLIVLIQYGFDIPANTDIGTEWASRDINIYCVWDHPVQQTVQLLEEMMGFRLVAFNLVFDFFHLNKLYSLLFTLTARGLAQGTLLDILLASPDAFFDAEEAARDADVCLKPAAALDLMLVAQTGKYQGLMARKDIIIRRVPTQLAVDLREELDKRIQIPNIYFAKKVDSDVRWQLADVTRDGEVDPTFKDVVLRFKPSRKLKHLIQHAYPELTSSVRFFGDVDPIGVNGRNFAPIECGWAPFTTAGDSHLVMLRKKEPRKYARRCTQRQLLVPYITHWTTYPEAMQYAADDVKYLRLLYVHLNCQVTDAPDMNSELTCQVAACRWSGYSLDLPRIVTLRNAAISQAATAPRTAKGAKYYIISACDPVEALVITSTSKAMLKAIQTWACSACEDEGGDCLICQNSRLSEPAKRARAVMLAREAASRVTIFDKLLHAGKLHASFKVIGTKSDRMSGDNKLNPQGFQHTDDFRACFTMADPGVFELWLGDSDSHEVAITEAIYEDPKLREELLSGLKVHALFGQKLSGLSYEEVMQSKGSEVDWYAKGKAGTFSIIYFGDAGTLVRKQGITEEVAEKAFKDFLDEHPVLRDKREEIVRRFSCFKQPKGIGSAVYWKEPEKFIESRLGFRRFFDLEYLVCRALFELAQKPPPEWKRFNNIKLSRRAERLQTPAGAVASALYGAGFGIQGQCVRAAGNHIVQSWGATVIKQLQLKIWGLQPVGVSPYIVKPMNVHDEVLCPVKPAFVEALHDLVAEFSAETRTTIPMYGMAWHKATDWSGK